MKGLKEVGMTLTYYRNLSRFFSDVKCYLHEKRYHYSIIKRDCAGL